MSRATDITLRLYIPIYADNIMKFHYLKKDDTIDYFYEKFIFMKSLTKYGGLFYCPSPTNSDLQNLFPYNIFHVKMAVISFLGIFRFEYGHIPWIGGSTECNIKLSMAKHILFQVNANS